MNKKLDLTIIDSIKSIVAAADCEVSYDINKHEETPNWLSKLLYKAVKREVVVVNVTLVRNLV